MTDAEIKNAIARCALSGVTTSLERAIPGAKLIDCDVCYDSARTVQVIVTVDSLTRQYEFTVREVYGS